MDVAAFLLERKRIREEIVSARAVSPEGPQEMVWVARGFKFFFFTKNMFKKAQALNTPLVRFALSTVAIKAFGAFLPAKFAAFFIPKTKI